MKSARALFISLCPVLCLSCAAPAPRPPDELLERMWQTRTAVLSPLSYWELRGRLAVRTNGHGGQASLAWQRAADHHSIRLNGPFGSGLVRVTQDAQGARMQDADNRLYEAASAEALLYQYTGWQLPIASLEWWVRGLPVPGPGSRRELDASGRLHTLHQQGWDVQYEDYTGFDGFELPSRLTLSRAAAGPMPAMDVRLVIDRWVQVK
jgi:outer membrane lipoprotein LolB